MTKQVILIRRDLKMRRGKEIAQGAHAAMMWLRFRRQPSLNAVEYEWLTGSMAKVTCQVADLAELESVVAAAQAAGLTAYTVTDEGRTEFDGVPTITAAAIGPDEVDKIDAITGNLKLY